MTLVRILWGILSLVISARQLDLLDGQTKKKGKLMPAVEH